MPDFTMMLDSKGMDMRVLSDGYLVCKPRVARTGIQEYLGHEVGRPSVDKVRVWRPETEVFSKDSIRSLANRPMTVEHPPVPVTASNWKDYAVGTVGDEVLREGEFLRVPLMLMDAAAIAEVRAGKAELSVGYTAELVWGDGVTPDGEAYNAKQTNIRANHVAITHTARGGSKLRMGDHKQETKMKKLTIDGIVIEMDEKDASIVERLIAKLETEVANANTSLATTKTQATNDSASALAVTQTKDAEIATLKQQLADSKVTPKKLQEMAMARAAVVVRAKALFDSCVCDDKTDEEIRRQVVNAKLGDTAKAWTDEMVTASFNTLALAVGDSHGDNNGGPRLGDVINVIGRDNFGGGGDQTTKAYNEYDAALAERWKTAGRRSA
jgi:hypothetical protein